MANRTIHEMITEDLGYCCELAFFTLYKRTSQVADRLGVTTRAVKYHKAAVRDGCSGCVNAPNCLAAKGREEIARQKASQDAARANRRK